MCYFKSFVIFYFTNLGEVFSETYFKVSCYFKGFNMFKSFVRSFSQQFKVGQEASLRKKISRQDIEKFIDVSGDANAVHSAVGSQRALVHGAYLNSLVSCVMGTKLPGSGTLVVKQTLIFPNKCFVDDTVTVTVRLIEVRKIIKVGFKCVVDDGNGCGDEKVVLYGDAQLIMDKPK